MAQRSSSKGAEVVRRSTNDLYDTNDSRFKTMYAQAFQDHMSKMTGADLQGLAASQTAGMTSPANQKNMAPRPSAGASRGGNRASLNGPNKPPLSSAGHHTMTPDPKR